jgi:hypothetical protein
MPTQGTTKWTGRNAGAARLRVTTAVAATLVVGCAHDRPRPPTDVPPALQVPAGQKLTRMLHATGVQIYQCKASARDPSRYTWVYQEPKADLSDRSGKDIGRHYAGPTWEAEDGSKVVGDVVARTDRRAPLRRAERDPVAPVEGEIQHREGRVRQGTVDPAFAHHRRAGAARFLRCRARRPAHPRCLFGGLLLL